MKKALLAIAVVGTLIAVIPAAAATIPSGQRMLGQQVLEPVYNDEIAGEIGYIMQPEHAPQPLPANPKARSPFYLVVYPTSSTLASTTTFLCRHTPTENCPTHGNAIAGLAQTREPLVYGGGVAGHDHLMDFPGAPDFNIAWVPTVVLFTPQGVQDGAINHHILTDAEIDAAVSGGDAIIVSLPQRTFVCASVPARLYDMATPLTP